MTTNTITNLDAFNAILPNGLKVADVINNIGKYGTGSKAGSPRDIALKEATGYGVDFWQPLVNFVHGSQKYKDNFVASGGVDGHINNYFTNNPYSPSEATPTETVPSVGDALVEANYPTLSPKWIKNILGGGTGGGLNALQVNVSKGTIPQIPAKYNLFPKQEVETVTPVNYTSLLNSGNYLQGNTPTLDLSKINMSPEYRQKFSELARNGVGSLIKQEEPKTGFFSGLRQSWDEMSGKDKLNTAVSGIKAVSDIYSTWKTHKMAKEQYKFQKDMYQKNYENQAKAYNSQLADRQARRVAEQPHAHASVQEYMDKYGARV